MIQLRNGGALFLLLLLGWGGTVQVGYAQVEPDTSRPQPDTTDVRSEGVDARPDTTRDRREPRAAQDPTEAPVDTVDLSEDQTDRHPSPDTVHVGGTSRDMVSRSPGTATNQAASPDSERAAPGEEASANEGWQTADVPMDTVEAGARIRIQREQIPAAARDTISSLSVTNADLRNLLRGIGEQYGVNLLVEDQIEKTATVRLSNLTVLDALQVICREHGLSLIQSGPVFRVRQPPEPPAEPPTVLYENGRVTLDLSKDELRTVAETLTKKTGTNVIVSDGVDGSISGFLQNVPLESGLSTLLDNNGYRLRRRDGIYVIDRKIQRSSRGGDRRRGGRSLWVDAENGSVDLEVQRAPVGEVLEEVAAQMDLNLVTYKTPEGQISASVNDMNVEEVFDLLFRASNVTYRQRDSTFFVGTRETSSIATTNLISLDHVKAERVPEMLPQSLKQKATIKVISEHNGLMVTGDNDAIDQLQSAISALDKPTPLILIEALVVDFTTTDLFDLGVEFGQDAERSEEAKGEGYQFGEDGFQLDGEDEKANEYLQKLIPLTSDFGIRNIGELPEDFFFQLRALSQEGKVDIRSRPQVAALSGHTASIEIGQTQYFILRKESPVRSPEGGAVIQETERFEQIEANVSLEITPWVTSSGEVTTEIRPEFSQPVGEFSAEVPPTINTRILESTVRLKEGETIILGGLIRDEKNVQHNKIPILGSIPLLGRLFRTRSSNTEKSELVIYLTPHVFYGEENEPDRWEQLREEMDLRDPREDL